MKSTCIVIENANLALCVTRALAACGLTDADVTVEETGPTVLLLCQDAGLARGLRAALVAHLDVVFDGAKALRVAPLGTLLVDPVAEMAAWGGDCAACPT